MSIISNEFSLIMSSSPLNGAQNISSFKNRYDIQFDNPIKIPSNAINPRVALVSMNVWNSSYNISASFNNNKLRLVLDGNELIITFPDGLYSLSQINAELSNQLLQAGFQAKRATFDANYSNSTCGILQAVVGDVVDFSATNSIGSILGFNPIQIVCAVANTYTFGANSASLNRVNNYLISSSIVGGKGIALNGNSTSIIASIPILSGPNELISYVSQNLSFINIDHLRGQDISLITNELLDQDRRPVNYGDETFEFVLVIKWESKI